MSMSEFDIRPAKDYVSPFKGRKSPAEMYLDKINEQTGNKYISIRQAADIIGINMETVRRVLRDETKIPHATDVFVKGKLSIYLLTDEDLADLAEFFQAETRAYAHLEAKYQGKVPATLRKRLGGDS